MTKTILSPLDEVALLKLKIARFAARRAEIDQELERSKARLQELESPIDEPENPEDGLPSFMRTATTSRARARRSQQEPTVHSEQKTRRAGSPKTPDPWGWEWPQFARPTTSSANKVTRCIAFRPYRASDDWPPDPALEALETDSKFCDGYFPRADGCIVNPTDSQVAERVYQAMAERTRLQNDYLPCKSLPSVLYVPGEVSYKLLGEGLELARHGFYEFCRQRVAGLSLGAYYDGPYSVRFGYSEMEGNDVEHFIPKDTLSNQRIRWALEDLPFVRNTFCHFCCCADSVFFELNCNLGRIQELLLAPGDEERAMRARGLRDRLRQAADPCMAEMETMEQISSLPLHAGLDWAPHHERSFDIMRRRRDTPVSLAIQQAIETWSERRCTLGKDREGVKSEDESTRQA